jgi:hypothetical protein
MRALFLDLASHPSTSSGQAQGLLACVTGERVTALEAVDHRVGDHELIPLFERVLSTASWGSKDLTHVACVIGPGGFTSLRVAVAFANTLAHELTIPAAGIHLSDLYAARITPHPPLGCARGNLSHPPSPLRSFGRAGWEREQGEASFLWLHSTKKYELFVRGFGEFVKFWPEATHVSVEGFLEKISPSPGASRHPLPEGEGTGPKQGRMDRDPSRQAALLAAVRAHVRHSTLRALLARALPGGRLAAPATLFDPQSG